MARGFIYVLVNAAMPGIVKIGRTSRSIQDRVSELSAYTGVPIPFAAAYWAEVSDVEAAEAETHSRLSVFRQNVNREFFQITPPEAIHVVQDIAARYELTDQADDGTDQPESAPSLYELNVYVLARWSGWDNPMQVRVGATKLNQEELLEKFSRLNSSFEVRFFKPAPFAGQVLAECERAFQHIEKNEAEGIVFYQADPADVITRVQSIFRQCQGQYAAERHKNSLGDKLDWEGV